LVKNTDIFAPSFTLSEQDNKFQDTQPPYAHAKQYLSSCYVIEMLILITENVATATILTTKPTVCTITCIV